jgi:hypothetical protein
MRFPAHVCPQYGSDRAPGATNCDVYESPGARRADYDARCSFDPSRRTHVIAELPTPRASSPRHPDVTEDSPDAPPMGMAMRAFWALVTATSFVLLYLTVLCALPRSPAGY